MDWSNELSPAARERLARVTPLSAEEKAAAADTAALDEMLRLYFKDNITSDDVLAHLKGLQAAGKWNVLRAARDKLKSSFKSADVRIQFSDNADGTITLDAGEPQASGGEPQCVAGSPKREGEMLELTDATFDAAVRDNPSLVVDCWAVWCGPCRMVAPVLEELAKDYAGKIVFGKLDVDKNRATAARFHIQSIPTILIFKSGKLVDQKMGAMPKAMLEPIVTKHLGGKETPPATTPA